MAKKSLAFVRTPLKPTERERFLIGVSRSQFHFVQRSSQLLRDFFSCCHMETNKNQANASGCGKDQIFMRRSPESSGHDLELAKVQKAHFGGQIVGCLYLVRYNGYGGQCY